MSVLGNAMMLTGFLLVGPAPFITSLVPSTGLIKGAAAIMGTGYPLIMVSTFGRSQAAALRNGYHDDLDTYIFISSKPILEYKKLTILQGKKNYLDRLRKKSLFEPVTF